MQSRLAKCPDCDGLVSVDALACPHCGRLFRALPLREGPFLRGLNGLTIGALVIFGIPIAFSAVVSLLQVVGLVIESVRMPLGR